ncbi:MAG: S-layer homology domain-containing protein [Candidatus Peribacteraceae bacterium]
MHRLSILAILLLAPVLVFAQVEPFIDVVGHPHASQVEYLHARGIVEGYGYGLFRPDISINRAEFLKIMMIAVYGDEEYSDEDAQCFQDFTGEEQWFWRHACAAKERGIIDGYPDGTFRGERTVNLAEALKIIIDARELRLPVYPDGPPNWYDPYFDIAASKRVFDDFPYDPAHLLTRSEMAVLIVTISPEVTGVGPQPREEEPVVPICGNGIVEADEQCDDGNNEDRDGCSSICIIVPEPVYHAALYLEQRPSGAIDQSEGSNDVTLLEFDVAAGRQDVLLTGLEFTSAVGNMNSAGNYRMLTDVDGDGVMETLVATGTAQGDILAFSDFSILVQDGVFRRIAIVADLADPGTPGTIALGFATQRLQYVTAVGVEDGRDLTGIDTDFAGCGEEICWISVVTDTPRDVTITDRGNLYVTADTVPVRSRQIRAGELSPVLLRVRLRAEAEDILITDMNFSGMSEHVDYLELYRGSSTTPFATARGITCATPATGRACAKTTFTIKQDQEDVILVKGFVRPDTPADVSGDTFALYLTSDIAAPAIEATGVGSDNALHQNDSDAFAEGEIFIGTNVPAVNAVIMSPIHDMAASTIIMIANAHDDADGTPVPLGTATFAAFRFTASSLVSSKNYPVHIRDLIFTVNAENVEIDPMTIALYNPLNANATKACVASGATGEIIVTCSNLENSVIGTTIDQGAYVDLAMRARIVNAQAGAGSSVLQASLNGLGDRTDTGTISWDDGTTTFDWVDITRTLVRSTRYRMD